MKFAGRWQEFEIQRDTLREMYRDKYPDNRILGRLVGEVTRSELDRHCREAAERRKPKAEAEREADRRQYESDRALAALEHGAFEDLLVDHYGDQCPGTDREPHPLSGYVDRAGHQSNCRLCGVTGSALEIWHKRHSEEGTNDE